MSVPFKSSPVEFNQHLLFPTNIFDLLPKDHDCFLYAELFQLIDTSSLESLYSIKGQNAYHPKLIVAILIYAYSQGVFSSRKIEKRCKEDLSFMFIAQMNCPNFRVLSDFRKDHGDFFQDCFKQTVKLAMELKLASLGHISLDGSKFKANTSKHKAMSYGRLQEKEQALCAEIDDLIEKANRCDQEEDKAYQDKTGYEIPEDLQFKQGRLAKIKAAKQALEQREEQLNPGKAIDDPRLRHAVADVLAQLDAGALRVAEKIRRQSGLALISGSRKPCCCLSASRTTAWCATATNYFDKVPAKFAAYGAQDFKAGGFRAVPLAAALVPSSAATWF